MVSDGAGRVALCSGWTGAVWLLCGGLSAWQLVLAVLVAYLVTGGWRTAHIAYRTLPRELRAVRRFCYLLFKMKIYERCNATVPQLFAASVKAQPHKTAILFEQQRWSFTELDEYSNRVGNYFLSRGFGKGDAIALFMENRPEYVGIWLGLAKIGAVPALINYNLKQSPLVHCVTAAKCRALVYGSELSHVVSPIKSDLGENFPLFKSGACLQNGDSNLDDSLQDLDALLRETPSSPPLLLDGTTLGYHDKLLYIYTSGTTGMPKAAVIKNSRALYIAIGTFVFMGWRRHDVLYSPLPQYHTAGCLMGTLTALLAGLTVGLRARFSASHFWTDCAQIQATVTQYIGETCRYLLNQPEKPQDRQHQVRLMFGNGLRPQIWAEFQRRFGVPLICEFYGSTEGNANVVNFEGRPGAVGFIPPLLPSVYPCLLVRVDDAGDPVRDARGLCVPCKPGEPGEFIGMMVRGNATRDFHGYADKSSTSKKILYDVKCKGDSAFRSGDLLVQDCDGYLFFRDRTGDTFRWKGENVSTSEVEGVVQRHLAGRVLAAVYGVCVPGAEGRAGMMALLDVRRRRCVAVDDAAHDYSHDGEARYRRVNGVHATADLDAVEDSDGRRVDTDGQQQEEDEEDVLALLADALRSELPAYAQPLFLRVVQQLDMTGTFKFKKIDLQREAFDLDRVSDPLYVLDAKLGRYVPLTRQIVDDISCGKRRI